MFFFSVYDKRATDESNNHDVGFYSKFQRRRGDGMCILFGLRSTY